MTIPLGVVVAGVRAAVARAVRAEHVDDVPLDRPLYEIGLDSLRAIELGQELAERFPIDPPTAFPHETTVATLADDVLQMMPTADRMSPGKMSNQAAASEVRCSTAVIGATVPSDYVLRTQVPWNDLRLASDDVVPHPMLLLFAYSYRLNPAEIASGLELGLNRFPHLTGRFVESADGASAEGATIVATDAGVRFEVREQVEDAPWAEWSTEPAERLRERFVPTAATNHGETDDGAICESEMPLLAVRLTHVSSGGGSVLAYYVSHRVLDGTGVALFLNECTAAQRGTEGRPVVHDRAVLRLAAAGEPCRLPPWYRPLPADTPPRTAEWDLATEYRLATFSVTDAELERRFGHLDRGALWLTVTALLLWEINRHVARTSSAGFTEAALWCDVRGAMGIPTNYTGNVGCYRHVRLTAETGEVGVAELVERLREPLTVDGRRRAAETYRACKQAEAAGIRTTWTGREPHVLPVNLVLFAPELLDFGQGGPTAARMLTRNVHGLRIARTGRDDGFVVESCLPDPANEFIHGLI